MGSRRPSCAVQRSADSTWHPGATAETVDFVVRIIADLDNAEAVSAKHLAEAVQYRSLDRNYWS
jgi:predicted ATPase with chaperone activity